MTRSLIGDELEESEERLLAVYGELKRLCSDPLTPTARANVRAALALIHCAVTSLGLEYEHLQDLGL